MKIKHFTVFSLVWLLSVPIIVEGQISIRNWEDVGSIQYTSAAMQGSKVVLSTGHGYLYSTVDFGATWQRYKLDDTLGLTGVAFADSMHGLVVDNTNIEFRTSDGGGTWVRSTVPATIIALAYPEKDTAFAIGSDNAVWRSTDAGNSWSKMFRVPVALHAISFLNARTGFIGGDSAIFFKTVDGGTNWAQSNSGLQAIPGVQNDRTIVSISYADAGHGVVGTDSSFWTTEDSGNTWQMHFIPNLYINYLDQPPIQLVIALDSHSLVVVDRDGLNYYSGDWGNTLKGATPADYETDLPQSWVKIPNGYLMAGNSELVETSKDGKTWQVISEAFPSGAKDLEPITSSTFGGVDDVSLFYSSNDSGITWRGKGLQLQGGGVFEGYDALHFFNKDTGTIFCFPSYVESFNTTDGGTTWQQIDSAGPRWEVPWALSFSSDGFGMSLENQNESLLYLTKDSSRTWATDTIVDSTTEPFHGYRIRYSNLNAASPLSGGKGYLSIDDLDTNGTAYNFHSKLLATTDYGKSWQWISTAPDTPNTQWMVFHNFDTGILYTGYQNLTTGFYNITTDAGQHWIRKIPPGGSTRRLAFLNDSTIVASGNENVMYYSTNLGISWDSSSIPVPPAWRKIGVKQILFPSKSEIYVVAQKGFFRGELRYGSAGVTQLGDYLSQFLYVQTYPDPAGQIVHVRLSGIYSNSTAPLSAELYDYLGRKVLDLTRLANDGDNGNTSEFDVNTNNLSNGVYMLKYTLGADSFEKPFVVIH